MDKLEVTQALLQISKFEHPTFSLMFPTISVALIASTSKPLPAFLELVSVYQSKEGALTSSGPAN